jgi:hypothetical protein
MGKKGVNVICNPYPAGGLAAGRAGGADVDTPTPSSLRIKSGCFIDSFQQFRFPRSQPLDSS